MYADVMDLENTESTLFLKKILTQKSTYFFTGNHILLYC